MAVQLGGLGACKSTRAGLEGEGAGERVDPTGAGAEGIDVPVDGAERVEADGCATEESVEVVGEGAGDAAEDDGGEGEVAEGGGGAEVKEAGAGGGVGEE
ncbi:hypothetical protein SAY87_000113 [Trapa incisa]|uniref:Uncharacterized protein n=1 Tax=Trapa incisa TaxID=236973 RepID=A0AAN7GMR4_9MYRT|nr:hypothetical protein SAY87_000113 [Trapa incisa]